MLDENCSIPSKHFPFQSTHRTRRSIAISTALLVQVRPVRPLVLQVATSIIRCDFNFQQEKGNNNSGIDGNQGAATQRERSPFTIMSDSIHSTTDRPFRHGNGTLQMRCRENWDQQQTISVHWGIILLLALLSFSYFPFSILLSGSCVAYPRL